MTLAAPTFRPRPSSLALVTLVLAVACVHRQVPGAPSGDALREVHEAYRRAWLANDPEGVLRLFDSHAVLMPHHGLDPVVGLEAIRRFWFGPGPPTEITRLELDYDEVAVDGRSGLVRGHSRVEWTVQRGSDLEHWGNAGTFLTLLRRGDDGVWRITHHVWDDPPNQRR